MFLKAIHQILSLGGGNAGIILLFCLLLYFNEYAYILYEKYVNNFKYAIKFPKT